MSLAEKETEVANTAVCNYCHQWNHIAADEQTKKKMEVARLQRSREL
ncbi:hypothetical protein PROFUN_13061 [Planoprotostelium fungivorum]|uniref:Uncharacterized protein n=1 Tax=Planoprotostelium fungivorum TaxID=1890364 RepID=A0A2P6N5F2_9EUKA|nr:hypothetical protein PROFUN_13061 [Planoprotostelium fungivorum]